MIQLGQGGVLRGRVHHQHLVQQALQGLQQPVPRHLLDSTGPAHQASVKKETEGRKKVLLELRHHSGGSSSASIVTKPESIVTVSSQPEAASSGRQQTYYIFHPMTQTFEPITIAEGLESAVVQEIVVGDENIMRSGLEDSIQDVHHQGYEETILGDVPSPPNGFVEIEARKPVISPVIKEGRKRPPNSEASASNLKVVRVESGSGKSQPQKTSVIRKLTNELIEETVVAETGDTFMARDHFGNNAPQQGIDDTSTHEVCVTDDDDDECQDVTERRKNVNIEDLVDVCFEEELTQNTILEENQIVNQVVQVLRKGKGKRSLEADDLVSLLPLKKRIQCKQIGLEECFVPPVDYFSHKILEFEFTTEEMSRLDLIKSQFQPSTRKDTDGNGLKCVVSTTTKFKDFIFALLPVSGALHESLSSRDAFKDALRLLATDFNLKALFVTLRREQSETSLRNHFLLLYRYLTSVCPVSEASSLTHAVQGIIKQCTSKSEFKVVLTFFLICLFQVRRISQEERIGILKLRNI